MQEKDRKVVIMLATLLFFYPYSISVTILLFLMKTAEVIKIFGRTFLRPISNEQSSNKY